MSLLALVGAVALAQAGAAAHEIETWADARLPVRDGLVLWIDASRQAAAYAAQGREVPGDGSPLGVAYDASGRRRDLIQRARALQPKFVAAGPSARIRFDGVDDALAASGLATELRDCTLFVRAAPRANPGGFRALFACNATGRNDYRSGMNVDLSFAPTARLEVVNVEGAGFGGAVDLLASSFEFGAFHTFTVECADAVALRVDGRDEGRRARDGTALRCDEVTLGARFYSNDSDVPATSGFLDGDVEEVVLFERHLSADERARVESYLADKHQAGERALAAASKLRRVALERTPPDPVRLFVPGFTATPLPLDLVNVNGVAFREDGTLVALGYDGNVFLLDDRDGDGVQESVRPFFTNRGSIVAPIGMALTPKGFAPKASAGSHGVVVACKGKIVLLADDGDDVAEREVVLASGWEAASIEHNVDALGVAIAPDGRVLFGLGTSDYTNAYLVDRAGAGHYRLESERGAILAIAPDLRSRRIVCTGIRFPVGIHFDRAGDLFATDQEGATWLPDGNPFDELLHIEEGRHYGFPPRHPRHLPGVLDEPSLFDYRPQHQSTCGFCFDEPAAGHPTFGPASWEGDALVAGYSRGKLYRTELVKSAAGFVARNQQLASFSLLVCDVALGPKGELIVACHSGAPDWGSGPTGRGRLFRLQYDGRAPQPVAMWAAGPQEVRIAFDRPLEPGRFEQTLASARATFGAYVGTGDRFEALWPGYQAVQRQLEAPRYDLPLLSLQISADRRTLSLATAPHVARLPHALSLAELELAYDLNGVEAEWSSTDGKQHATTWLPHLDLAVARRFTRGSADHDRFWKTIEAPGWLRLRGALDLVDLLHPEVQPGSKLDHDWPEEPVTLELRANVEATFVVRGGLRHDTDHAISVRLKPVRDHPIWFEIEMWAPAGSPELAVAVHTDEDPRPRALQLRRFFPPWAARLGEVEAATSSDDGFAPREELAGGNWERGRTVFFGPDAMCSKCHTLDDGSGRGARAKIGPDLSKLWQRDVVSVRRDVLDPNAAINPDFAAVHFVLRDGRELAGVARRADLAAGADPEAWIVGEAGGKETAIHSNDVATREPLATSIMPAGLQNVLSPQQVTDLLTYVLARPLEPAPISIEGAPPPCPLAEFEALAPPPRAADAADPEPLRVVLVAGEKDHGLNEHDYPDWQQRWAPLLARADRVAVETAQGWPSAAQLAAADVVVMFSANPAWSAARGAELDPFLARGGGLVLIHYAVNGGSAVAEYAQRIGLAWRNGSKFRHGALDLDFLAPRRGATSADAIVAGFHRLHLVDETYWDLSGDESSVRVLATAVEDGQPRPQIWAREVGKGRIVGFLPGHYRWTFDDPRVRLLLLRAIAWAGGQPVERLAELATLGARLER